MIAKRKEYCTERGFKAAFTMAKAGYTMVRMARMFGVSRRTFLYWRKTFPAMQEAVENGREEAAREITQVLHGIRASVKRNRENANDLLLAALSHCNAATPARQGCEKP